MLSNEKKYNPLQEINKIIAYYKKQYRKMDSEDYTELMFHLKNAKMCIKILKPNAKY